MRKKKGNTDRHLDLSSKFIEMGQALMKEGNDKKDYTISQSGTFMVLIGGLMFDEDDIHEFNQLCSMFSAKKILDNIEIKNNDVSNIINMKFNDESYDDFIKRIKDLRENKGFPPLSD